jgi:ketopantoate reductase
MANAAVLVAGAGSTGGILVACLSKSKNCVSKSKRGVRKFRNLFQTNGLSLSQNSASRSSVSKKIKEK